MNYNEAVGRGKVDFGQMQLQAFLLGLLSAFDNRYQASADSFMKEITWKQFFAIICIKLCREAPTLNDLADVMGSSHQNVKQILLKLERKGFVSMTTDGKDRRKQRIVLTDRCREFCEKNDAPSQTIISRIFEGIEENKLITTIETIMAMERNVSKL